MMFKDDELDGATMIYHANSKGNVICWFQMLVIDMKYHNLYRARLNFIHD
jgi:hypothetical protein